MSCPHAYTRIEESRMACPPASPLTEAETVESPYALYRWMLDEAPAYFDPGLDMYIVASYDLIRKVALDTEGFSNQQAQLTQWNLRPGGMPARAMEIPDGGVPQVPMLVTSDPPQHKRSRVLVQMAFTAPRVQRMQTYIEEIVDLLIDGF